MKNNEAKEIKKLYGRLTKAEIHEFPEKRASLSAPKKRGVYIIRDPHNDVAHVGRTPRAKNGLHQRLKNHLQGKSSFVRNYLNGNREVLRMGWKYQYLEIKNDRERALLEALATGILCPKHLGLGNRK